MTFRTLLDRSRVLVARMRGLKPKTWIKVGACVAVAGLCATEVALRGDVEPRPPRARAVHMRQASDAPRSTEMDRWIAMTRASTCEERSKAADALAGVRHRKAVAALKRLASSSFKDESASPGVFSCSSRRAAQRALDQQGT